MARYNTVSTTGSIAQGSIISSPYSGLLTTITTGSGTTTLPNPVLYAGSTQTFYNATVAAVTIQTPSGVFNGPGTGSASTLSLPVGAVITLVSDGTNYIAQDWLGGPASHTTITASGTITAQSTVTFNPSNANVSIQPSGTGTVTINPATAGTLDNVAIGATTATTGKFTTMNATSLVTSSYTQSSNFQDSAGAFNANLGSGGTIGRGAVAGYSGGFYGGIGYNITHTSTSGVYNKPLADQTSYLRFDNGGFIFLTNTSVSSASSIPLTQIGALSNAGALTLTSAVQAQKPSSMVDGGTTTNILGGSLLIAPTAFTAGNNSYLNISFPDNSNVRFGIDFDGHISGTTYRNIQFGRVGTPYVVINDGGNVGINLTNPRTIHDVHGGTSTFALGSGSSTIDSNTTALQIGPQSQRSATAGTYYAGIAYNHLLSYSGTGTNGYFGYPQAWTGLKLYDTPGTERSSYVIATKPTTSNTAADIPIERMTIDPFGRVTKPYQPAFSMYVSANLTGAAGIVPFGGSIFNTGSYFNTSTYQFTAPVAGRYFFSFYDNVSKTAGTGDYFGFRVNGSLRGAYGYNSSPGTWIEYSMTQVMDLAANDVVDVYNYTADSHPDYGSAAWGNFSGYFLG